MTIKKTFFCELLYLLAILFEMYVIYFVKDFFQVKLTVIFPSKQIVEWKFNKHICISNNGLFSIKKEHFIICMTSTAIDNNLIFVECRNKLFLFFLVILLIQWNTAHIMRNKKQKNII